jgi:hypothetical protein
MAAAVNTPSFVQLPSLAGLLQRVAENNTGLDQVERLTPWRIDGTVAGHLRPSFVAHLAKFPHVFVIRGDPGPTGVVELHPSVDTTAEARTQAVAQVLDQLREQGVIQGWRNELYPVTPSFYSPPLMLVSNVGVLA